ncbi:NADPH-dependent oxidoreductase [Labrys monachus]|uniref:Nitroreductase n=1 Tax=Labrys monachus TaxID=217067 RepID=A0ABU0FGW8_9HYPH|nr:NADPH-dependent oxidoreductase [Labrys monachus]MDQ0393587.1 nitroreductase [Labrys monachus]
MNDQSPAHDRQPPSPARERVRARYRDEDFAERLASIPWNGALDTMLLHRSVRTYLDKPLAPGILETIIAAAQSAATTSNLQAWSVVAVQDKARKARLAGYAANQKHIHDAPLLLLFVADLARLRAISRDQGHPGLGLGYIEAFIFGVADASFAAQNTITAAESLGLGGCYIGAMRNNPQAVADEIGLPDETMVVFGMTIGYPDPATATDVKPRLPQDVVLHHERYVAPDPARIAAYDARMHDFRVEQEMRLIDWTEQTARRVSDEAALTGRHVLKDFLQQRGLILR